MVKTLKVEKTHLKGEYSDRDIISLVSGHKAIPKENPIWLFLAICREVQKTFKTKDLTSFELAEVIRGVLNNPPPKPEPKLVVKKEVVKVDHNQHTSSLVNGKERLTFSEKGMRNLRYNENEMFESVEKDEYVDREDDGRVTFVRKTRRVSDGKVFSFTYIDHHEYESTFFDNYMDEV